jgi:hypothetical protein
MQEAKGSFNGYFRSPQGNKDQFTLRQSEEQSDKDFVLRVRSFVKLLAENGWTEWYAAENESSSPRELDKAKLQEGGENGDGQKSVSRNGKSFEVESIKLAAGGDHPRWVVKGGNFKKFGVTCWPETLEAAGIAEKLDPLKDNKPKGNWVAHYNERENDEGKWVPDKVVSLEKVKS